MPKQFTLNKNERLKSRKQIEALFAEGKKFVVAPFRIFFQIEKGGVANKEKNYLQFGVGVSAKNFKKAVERNRIKRLIREEWRLQKNSLKEKLKSSKTKLNVFFIYTGNEMPDLKLIKDKVVVILNKLSEKTDEIISENS